MYENLYSLAESNNADMVKSAFYEYTDGKGSSKINWSEQYLMPDVSLRLKNILNFYTSTQAFGLAYIKQIFSKAIKYYLKK